jgi:hypothetical protein
MSAARENLLELINGAWATQAIGTACELGLPDLLAGTAQDAGVLAAAARCDPDAIERLLRALATLGLCREETPGTFALTEAGLWLRRDRDDSLDAWARLSATRLWNNWSGLAESVRTGRSTRSRVQGSEDFRHLNDNAGGAALFNLAMLTYTAPVARAASARLDWSDRGIVVDVGGGAGLLAATILADHAHLRGIVYDLEHAEPAARQTLARAGLRGRCTFESGSFFERVPAGDALLMKSVLHNWDDERAATILGCCAAALAPGGRVVLFERVLARRASDCAAERDDARSDLNMLVGCDGRERTEDAFRALLASAGLAWRRTVNLAAGFSALEAVRA